MRIAFIAALALLALPAGAEAGFPGQNGKIAYDRYDAETDETVICAITPGGAAQCPFPGAFGIAPAWSASGAKMAFVGGGIRSVNANGSGTTAITSDFADQNPAWSPGGDRIAFSKVTCTPTCRGEIYTMNADGTGQIELTDDPADDDRPAWSPDGGQIAWERDFSIWTMKPDGSAKVNLGSGSAPNWSPDGTKLAFYLGGI